MEFIMLIGIPATGKSSFYRARLADTHVRVNGDMLRGNRSCEADLIEACLRHGQPLCLDKMNFTRQHREPYLERAKQMGFLRVGYYFASIKRDALQRNQNPDRREKNLPDVAIHNAATHLELPRYREGFDRLYRVELVPDDFVVTPWELEAQP